MGNSSGQKTLRILKYLCLFTVCLKSQFYSVFCLPLIFLFLNYYEILGKKQRRQRVLLTLVDPGKQHGIKQNELI